jgi:hypothetical protein
VVQFEITMKLISTCATLQSLLGEIDCFSVSKKCGTRIMTYNDSKLRYYPK